MTTLETGTRGPSRRRGPTLERAILAAAYDELVGVGYAEFSYDRVAGRARTGKASIYRRWPRKPELVLDALCEMLPDCAFTLHVEDGVSTNDALRGLATTITDILASPAGAAMRSIKLEASGDPELAELVDARFQEPRRAAMLALLRRGVERGEVRPDAVTTGVADVLPAILMYRVVMQGEPITPHVVSDILEHILIPLIEVQ